ncbi:MAG: hypothetical protein QF726_02980 [Alphaproteobacteria bacterium]|jgi:hypothetical protein|nr:hypothetical protein [Alphaproteobacteria bacterium]|tara:strand:+ start:134 stop:541 length:408 start_codon:yes stop_codon:yes gene_type:complete
MFTLDPELPPDVATVLESASLLEVSEYRIFEMAYEAWFGRKVDNNAKLLDRQFFAYLHRDSVPPWVRSFCRDLTRRGRAPGFDPARYGIVHAPPTRTMIYLGIRYAMWTALTVSVIIGLAHAAAIPAGCIFPPCY